MDIGVEDDYTCASGDYFQSFDDIWGLLSSVAWPSLRGESGIS